MSTAVLKETSKLVGVDFGVKDPEYTTECSCGWSVSWLSTGHRYFSTPRSDYDNAILLHRMEHLEGKI